LIEPVDDPALEARLEYLYRVLGRWEV